MNIIRHEPGPILSSAVEYGNLVFVAGTVANDTSLDAEGQTRDVLAQIDALLAKAGTSKSRILMANIYVTDIRNREAVNKAWGPWVDAANTPARATIEAKLADPAMLVEISCIAAK
jgi:enamine deaminase RidA (YjgF/YER057c/UK114 family)